METTFFQAIDLFSNASPHSLEKLAQLAKRHTYKKGSVILNPHQALSSFLYVVKGWIKLFKESKDGEEIIVDILTQQHYSGEQFIFNSNEEESYIAQAISDVEIVTVPTPCLKQLTFSDHQLALKLLEDTIEKQQHSNLELEHLSIQNAAQRIGCFMLRLYDAKKGNTMATVRLPYDKVLLASRLGMRAETFSRALAKLSKECDIDINDDTFHINNIASVSQYVCAHCSKKYPCHAAI